MDYLMGVLLMVAPWLFEFYRNGAESWVPFVLGLGIILYSLFTDYELGAKRTISMRTHLNIDLLGGALLAVSPWLFGFSDFVFLPHLVLGIAEMGASLMTKVHPSGETQNNGVHGAQTASAHQSLLFGMVVTYAIRH